MTKEEKDKLNEEARELHWLIFRYEQGHYDRFNIAVISEREHAYNSVDIAQVDTQALVIAALRVRLSEITNILKREY